MLYADRRFCVTSEDDAEQLAHKLTARTWTGCTGFRHADYLFLNDSFSSDGAQEFAVFKNPESGGRLVQIESITFGWMDVDEALIVIRNIVRGRYDEVMHLVQELAVESPEQHERCPLCA